MSIPLIINGVTFQYPQQFDKNWGPTLTNWSTAVTNGMLQKAGGAFTLTAEVDFGSSFGMAVKSIKSKETNIATTGFLRLGNASPGIVWRNALHNADLALTVNASNQLTFNGIAIGASTSLTDGHIFVGDASNQPADVAMSGDITISNTGVTTLGAGKVLDANINASAAIALSKLAATTAYYWYAANSSGVLTPLAVSASKIVTSDANGLPTTVSSPTLTELGYVGGVTSAIQTQIDSKLALAGGTMAGVINMASNKIISIGNGSSTGDAVALNQLKVRQIVTATNSTAASPGSSQTYIDSNLTATITPMSVSSKIRITVYHSVLVDANAVNSQVVSLKMRIVRNATTLKETLNFLRLLGVVSLHIQNNAMVSDTYIDSPATTSPITYKTQVANYTGNGSVSTCLDGDIETIILEEIVD